MRIVALIHSGTLEGGTANHRNVLGILHGIKPYSTPVQRYKVRNSHKVSFPVVTLLPVTLQLNPS